MILDYMLIFLLHKVELYSKKRVEKVISDTIFDYNHIFIQD